MTEAVLAPRDAPRDEMMELTAALGNRHEREALDGLALTPLTPQEYQRLPAAA